MAGRSRDSTRRRRIAQLPGIPELIDDALGSAAAAEPTDPAVAAVAPRLRAAADAAKAALTGFERHLREVVLPASEGEGRLGRDLFARKLFHTFGSDDVTIGSIGKQSAAEFAAVRGEMIRIAREIGPRWLEDRPVPDDDSAAVREVLDAIALEHPDREAILDFCREEVGRIEAFCRDRDLIGLADDPLEIRWTPVFMRSFGGAMLDSPGTTRSGPEDVLLRDADPGRLDRGAGRVVPPRGQRPDAPPADDPRGGARPLPPGRLREPLSVDRSDRSSAAGSSPRAGRSTSPRSCSMPATARTIRRFC